MSIFLHRWRRRRNAAGLLAVLALFVLPKAEADPCTQISHQFVSSLQQHLLPGTLIFGPQAYPSILAESLVFVPARPQTDMLEVTIDGSERLDLRTAYIRTGKMQFRSLAAIAGCDLYDQPEFIDFEKIPDQFALTKPTIFPVSHCTGAFDRARLVSAQDAFLYYATGEPFCVIFEPDFFDPFGLIECSKEKSHVAPWESVKYISGVLRVPAGHAQQTYILDISLITTIVSDERCLGCYPEIDCEKNTQSESTITRKTSVDLGAGHYQARLPIPEISMLNFHHLVTRFELRLTLSTGSDVLQVLKIAPEWPRCC